MHIRLDFTDRVTDRGDGVYCWRSSINREYEMEKLKIGFIGCIFIFFFILILGLVFSIDAGNPESFIPVALSAVGFLVIVIVVFGLSAYLSDTPGEVYSMRDSFMQTGTGKTTVTFDYKGAKKVRVTSRYIELKGTIKKIRVYVPAEDMSFVRNYILGRVSGDAQISYE